MPACDMPGNALLAGARIAGSGALALAATGCAEAVTRLAYDEPHQHDWVWWYCRPGGGVGFAPRADV